MTRILLIEVFCCQILLIKKFKPQSYSAGWERTTMMIKMIIMMKLILYPAGWFDLMQRGKAKRSSAKLSSFCSQPDGLILYNGGKDNDFIAIELIQGHLHYTYNMG